MLKHVAAHAPVLQHALRGAGAAQRAQADVGQGHVPAAAAAAARPRRPLVAGCQRVQLVLDVKQQPDVVVWGGEEGDQHKAGSARWVAWEGTGCHLAQLSSRSAQAHRLTTRQP
jgi:hypothetical protein